MILVCSKSLSFLIVEVSTSTVDALTSAADTLTHVADALTSWTLQQSDAFNNCLVSRLSEV